LPHSKNIRQIILQTETTGSGGGGDPLAAGRR